MKKPKLVALSAVRVPEAVALAIAETAEAEGRTAPQVARIVLEAAAAAGMFTPAAESSIVDRARTLVERPRERRPLVLDRRGLVAVPGSAE